MKFLTLNCFLSPWSRRRKDRLPFIVKALTEEKPDIIFLQELFFNSDANYIAEKLAEVGFGSSFYSRSLFIASRFPFLSKDFFEFSPHLGRHIPLNLVEIGNWIYGKGFQVVSVRTEGRTVTLANLHLLAAYGRDDGVYRAARLRQLKKVCDYLKRTDASPLVVAGDFNFDINSPSYLAIKSDCGLEDPLEMVVGNSITADNSNRKSFLMKKMNQRIDHIFIKGFEKDRKIGQVVFQRPFLIGGEPTHVSDHCGLALTVRRHESVV